MRLPTRGPRIRRRRTALGVVALLAALLGWALLAPSSALAVCAPGVSAGTDPPTPEMPGTGLMGWIESPPNPLPKDADPFQPNSGTTIEEQYGYAGLRWNTYDLGCGGDLADPISAGENAVANITMVFPAMWSAITGAMLRWAFVPDFLKVFDPMVQGVVGGLKGSVFLVWLPVPGIVLGSILLFKAHRSQASDTAAAIAGAFVVLFAACLIFNFPLLAGHTADKIVTSTNATLVGGLNGKVGANADQVRSTASEMESNLHSSVLYPSWLLGELGRGHDGVAKRYGPDLWKAQTFTWREAQEYSADPNGRGADLIDQKQTLWDSTTQKIKDEDPDAYANLTGHRAEIRIGAAWIAMFGILCAIPFLVLAACLVILALMIVRFAMMFAPVVALFGLMPQTRHVVTGLARTVAAACINCVVFTFGAALLVRSFMFITDPGNGLNGLLQMVLMALTSIIFWVALRPFRKLTQMVGKRNHFAEAAGGISQEGHRAGRFAWGVAKQAAGVSLGFKFGRWWSGGKGGDETPPAEETARVEETVTAPPPEQPKAAGPSALGKSIYDPDDVRTAREADARTLRAESHREPSMPKQRGPASSEARAAEQDNEGNTVYKIYSDESTPVYKGSEGGGGHFDPGAVSSLPSGPSGSGE